LKVSCTLYAFCVAKCQTQAHNRWKQSERERRKRMRKRRKRMRNRRKSKERRVLSRLDLAD